MEQSFQKVKFSFFFESYLKGVCIVSQNMYSRSLIFDSRKNFSEVISDKYVLCSDHVFQKLNLSIAKFYHQS